LPRGGFTMMCPPVSIAEELLADRNTALSQHETQGAMGAYGRGTPMPPEDLAEPPGNGRPVRR
jgi:hypothetical protein